MNTLTKLVAPRVACAFFKMLWNGWGTDYRFQKNSGCKLGCGSEYANDSIEHYCCCQVVKEVAWKKLKRKAMKDSMLLAANNMTPEDITAYSLLCYAIFTSLITVAKYSPVNSRKSGFDLISHKLIEGVRGHKPSQRFLDTVWVAGPLS